MKTPLTILTLVLTISMNSQAENKQKAIDSIQSLLKTARDTERVNLLNKISEKFIENDDYKSAIASGEESKTLAQRLRFTYGESAASRFVGIANTCNGQYAIALNNLFHALKLAEDIKNDYLIGKIYNSIGNNYSIQKDNSALSYFFKSISFYYSPLVYEDIARAYHRQNRDVLAIEYYKKALSSDIPQIEQSHILNDLGDIYECKNNLDTALVFYLKSLSIATKLQDDAGIFDATGSIGDLFIKMGKYSDAITYENYSLKIAKKINNKYGIAQSEKALSDIYQLIGNIKMSFKCYKEYIFFRDATFNEETSKQTVRAEMNYQFDKKEAMQKLEQSKREEVQKLELRKKQNERNGFVIGMCIVIVFSIFLFRSYKKIQKAKNIISEQKKILSDKNDERDSSIRYALRIQQAILPTEGFIKSIMPEHMIIFEPKDVLSGDMYYVNKKDNKIIWGTLDATGHGIPSSLLNSLGSNVLSEIVKGGEVVPSKILDKFNERINESLHKTDDNSIRDGFDMTLCSLDMSTMELSFAGANNPLWLIKGSTGELVEFKTDKKAIGQLEKKEPYTNYSIQLEKGDVVYSFSDGIVDMHNKDNRKFLKKRFRELLLSAYGKSMPEQKEIICNGLHEWGKDAERVDDILLIGVRV